MNQIDALGCASHLRSGVTKASTHGDGKAAGLLSLNRSDQREHVVCYAGIEHANQFDRASLPILRICVDESVSPIVADVRMARRCRN